MTIMKSEGIFKTFAVEGMVAKYNGRKIVFLTSRLPCENGWLQVVDYVTGDLITKVPNQGMMLGCVIVVKVGGVDTLYFFGTENVGSPGNSICSMSSNDPDLLVWTEKTLIWTAGDPRQKIYNTSITQAGMTGGVPDFLLTYETSEPYNGYPDFNHRFLVSNGIAGPYSPYGGVVGSDRYVACGFIWYDEATQYFYMPHLIWNGSAFCTAIMRTTDPAGGWVTAPRYLISPAMASDSFNVSDFDCVEEGGVTYGICSVGDQTTKMDMKQFFVATTMSAWFASCF